MTPNTMGKLLSTIDPLAMRQHSVVNYRVQGLDCLTLHHSPDLTIKLFVMEDTRDMPDTLLAPPHAYRKPYSIVVLNGCIDHVICDKQPGDGWQEYIYDPKRRETTASEKCSLTCRKFVYGYRQDFWCPSDIIHTVQVRRDWGPLVIGMTQLRAERTTNRFYLDEHGIDAYPKADQRQPTVQETMEMIERAKFYVNRHFNVLDKTNPDLRGNSKATHKGDLKLTT